ncbi:MAG: hypothetical protein JWM82_2025 [Myxococcales bacterium]|nr:hypothetical protein [Myxococcales bacterium]
MEGERRKVGRKLLVASLGVASVSYLGCGGKALTPQKLDAAAEVAADDDAADANAADAGADEAPPASDANDAETRGSSDSADAALDRQFVGNLIP